MGHWIANHLNYYFAHWGYWTVFIVILLESAGVPVPGETVLIMAGAQAGKHQLNVVAVGVIAVIAAIVGDNIGFVLGKHGGRPLLERYRHLFHIKVETIRQGERLIHRHGGLTVFFARFVAGLRVVAGPLCGVLLMPWRRFLLFNALGALAWVTVITVLAFYFGPALESAVQHASWLIVAALVVAGAGYWWWRR